jgi:hypothetical protein
MVSWENPGGKDLIRDKRVSWYSSIETGGKYETLIIACYFFKYDKVVGFKVLTAVIM